MRQYITGGWYVRWMDGVHKVVKEGVLTGWECTVTMNKIAARDLRIIFTNEVYDLLTHQNTLISALFCCTGVNAVSTQLCREPEPFCLFDTSSWLPCRINWLSPFVTGCFFPWIAWAAALWTSSGALGHLFGSERCNKHLLSLFSIFEGLSQWLHS